MRKIFVALCGCILSGIPACTGKSLDVGEGSDRTSDGGSDAAALADGGPRACRADELCFDVSPLRPGTTPLSGRLTLVWFQFDDDGPDPPLKAGYQAPFNGTDTRVVIPLSEVVPPDEVHLWCERACDDEATCPCLDDPYPKPAIGYVVVLPETASAPLIWTVRELLGAASMAVGFSDRTFKPSPPRFSRVFPDGLEKGVRGYISVPAEGGIFDAMGYAAPGTVYQLRVCDTADRRVCDAKPPNLS